MFEPVLAERAIGRVMDHYVEPGARDLCLSIYYADESPVGEIIESAQTLPFLTERRVVVVHRAERLQTDQAARVMLPYLESPNESTVLLLVAQDIDRRSKFYKACEKGGEVVECGLLQEREAVAWAREEFTRRGKEPVPAALTFLIERTGRGLSEVTNAIEMVSNFVGPEEKTITEEAVAEACTDAHEDLVWDMTDAIARSDPREALRVLRRILDPGKNEFQILGSINWLLRQAYGVAAGGDARAGTSSFVAKKAKPLADKFGLPRFRGAFGLCVNTDLMMRSTGVDRSLALELLVIKLAAPAGGRARRSS